MNKHLVAFISVFSLGLILSIYYVLIPTNSLDQAVTAPPSSSATYTPELYFSALESERKENHDRIVSACESIVTDETKGKEEKEVAIDRIQKENSLYTMELTIDRNLATLGMNLACTQIDEADKSVSIVIYEDTDQKKIDQVSLMYMVLNTLNDNSYDVSFLLHH